MAGTQQLLRFFLNDPPPLFIELPSSLADGPNLGVHGEAVGQEIRVYVWHVRGGQCKGVQVSCYHPNDLILLCLVQRLTELERFAPKLPLHDIPSWLGSPLPSAFCTGHPCAGFPISTGWALDNREHPPFGLEAVLVAPLCLLLV